MIFVLVFSLLFGAGAIFILTWNASIISSVISISANYSFKSIPLGLSRLIIHGLPEIAAYFITAIAGGMVSLAVASFIRKKISKNNLLKIIQRASFLLLIGIILLVIAALLEIYVSSLF